MEPGKAARVPFPKYPEEFDADDRISFSKVSNRFLLEAEDGEEFEFDDALKRWVPVLDEELLEQQRKAYAVHGVNESEPAIHPKKKRKQNQDGEDVHSGPSKKTKHPQEARERKNTAIYITNLPQDASVEEVESVFSRCGVIAEEIDGKQPRIKLYTDDQGRFKGDALIVYFRAESVKLAIQMLDDTDFRLGQSAPSGRMKVSAADFNYKAQKDAPTKSNDKDKQKIIKKTQKLNSKLADWDDDDPSTLQVSSSSKFEKIVILKHMFTLKELADDPEARNDIAEDVESECATLGPVETVTLYDEEADGVITVRFEDAESAEACVQKMNGRMFDGRRVIAYVSDRHEHFRMGIAAKEREKRVQDDEKGLEPENGHD